MYVCAHADLCDLANFWTIFWACVWRQFLVCIAMIASETAETLVREINSNSLELDFC